MPPQKLLQQQERDVALAYLCGGSSVLEYVCKRYDICQATVTNNIVRKRSYDWNDALVEFYRQRDASDRVSNAAHLYVCFHDGDTCLPNAKLPNAKLVDVERDKAVYRILGKTVFSPVANLEIFLEPFVEPKTGYELLLSDILGRDWSKSERIVHTMVAKRLGEMYDKERIDAHKIRRLCYDIREELASRIKDSAFSMTGYKKRFIDEVLECMHPRVKEVTAMYYRLDEKRYAKRLTYEQIGTELQITRDRVRQIIATLHRNFAEHQSFRIFREMAKPLTDTELKQKVECIRYEQEKARWFKLLYPEFLAILRPDEVPESVRAGLQQKCLATEQIEQLNLSVRTRNCLVVSGIDTIGMLVGLSENELLHTRNFGRKSLKEIKDVLRGIGLGLRPDTR